MKFYGRNGGMAVAIRNHIMVFRVFVIALPIALVPSILLACFGNPYFWVFLVFPLLLLLASFAVLLSASYDERVFLGDTKKDHVFEICDDILRKDGKEIKRICSVKIYYYKRFLYMETSRSMFVIRNTDFTEGDREHLLSWARTHGIRVARGY